MNLIPRVSLLRSFVLGGVPLVLLALFTVGAGMTASAQGTRLWTQSRMEEFEKGTPEGVQITSSGKLLPGPVARDLLTTPSSFVWSVDVDKGGVAYLATGSPASVLRVNAASKTGQSGQAGQTSFAKLFESKALAVEVVRVGPDGAIYAATLPDGRVYRLKADASAAVDESSAEVVLDLGKMDLGKTDLAKTDLAKMDPADTAKAADQAGPDAKKPDAKAHYIWDMTFDSAGRLYVATGGPAAIYRLDVKEKQPKPELFFKSDEQHIRTLAWERTEKDGVSNLTGNLIAGTDGSGLVYRIDPAGKGYVLFSAPRREITTVAVGADGTIYAADVGDKNHNPLPQLPVQNGGSGITITFSQPGSVQAANASTALPEGTEIYALTPNQAPRKIWSDKDAIVYQLAATDSGLLALSGNRGRIYEIHKDGSYSDLAHLEAQQAVAMAGTPLGWLVATSNTGKLYQLEYSKTPGGSAGIASYASDVLDAGALAKWGHMEVEPESHGYKLLTRSGNVEQPLRREKDWGWSDWQVAANNQIASPPGRYLQWKVELNGQIGGVGVNYLPVNSAPQVDEVVVVPGARILAQAQMAQPGTVSIGFSSAAAGAGVVFDASAASTPIQAQKDRGAVTVRWAAHDDDSDDLLYDLYLRGDGERNWLPLKKGLTEKAYSFDATAFPDGGYTLKVAASDAPSHSPGDALTGEMVSERFELDTTPPVVSALRAGAVVPLDCRKARCTPGVTAILAIPVSFSAADAVSAIGHAEYSLDAGPWQYIEPVGELSDAKEERYSVLIPLPVANGNSAPTEHLVTVRVYDRHENMGSGKVIVPAAEDK